MGLTNLLPTILKVDDQTALSIAANSVLHKRTKHVDIDCNYIRDKINAGEIKTCHVPLYAHVADILTKFLSVKWHYYILDKFGASIKHSSPFKGE